MSLYPSFLISDLRVFFEPQAKSKTRPSTVRLSYQDVKGLDTSSRAFQRVAALDAKRSSSDFSRKRPRVDAWDDTTLQETGTYFPRLILIRKLTSFLLADKLSIDNSFARGAIAEAEAIINQTNFAQYSEQALSKSCSNLHAEIQVLTHTLQTSLKLRALLVTDYERVFQLLHDRSLAEAANGSIIIDTDEEVKSSSKGKAKDTSTDSPIDVVDLDTL